MSVPMRSFSNLLKIVNLKSVVISALAVLSTWLCLVFHIKADFPLTLIATAIVFPLVFSISTAYTRREKALEEYANLKSHGRSFYLAARDWLSSADQQLETGIAETLGELLGACRDFVMSPLNGDVRQEARVYDAFSKLSLFVKDMRARDLSATECSRLNQYITRMLTAFENMRHIYEYRTPRTLRAFSDLFILLLPILYGPYFAFEAAAFRLDLFFIMPVLFALILVGLANIQDELENPFDQIGPDDLAIDPNRFVASLRTDLTEQATAP